MIYYLRCVLFTLLMCVWSAAVCLAFIPAMPFDRIIIKSGRVWVSGIYVLLRLCCNITYEVRGEEYIKNGPYIYACKHQSAWETLVFWVLLERPVWVLKRSLIFLPLVGQYMVRLGSIYIDRGGGAKTLKKMLASARKMLDRGRPIVIYPEGTRKPVGAAPDYQSGIAAFYTYLKVPVVPVGLNSGLYWPKNSTRKRPGRVIIEFLPPIGPGLARDSFMQQLENAIETSTNALVREGQATLQGL